MLGIKVNAVYKLDGLAAQVDRVGRRGWAIKTPTSTRVTGYAGCPGRGVAETEGGVDLRTTSTGREGEVAARRKGRWKWELRVRGKRRPGKRRAGESRVTAAGFGGGGGRRARAQRYEWKEGSGERKIRMNEGRGRWGRVAEVGAGGRGGGRRGGSRRRGRERPRRCSRSAGGRRRGGPSARGDEETPRRGMRKPRAGPTAPASPPKWGRGAGKRAV